ncbi:MAG: GNAT family N-acetyltransferase [Acidimicrobiales bacterium]|nr:GNAT family N-acetyltransferase [Acidimicrobiales bacterium]
MHPLDAPAHAALTGPAARFAEVVPGARRYHPDVSVFAAVDPDSDGSALADLLDPGEVVFLVGQPAPPGTEDLGGGDGHQMVLDAVAPQVRCDDEVVELGARDADEMAALVAAARPGPWRPRTWELGTYLGIRRGGELVAMAGERFRMPGWTEISAVSTAESVRRQGLASVLVSEVARRIQTRGDTPCLHVATTNLTALPVYEKLGFRERRLITFRAVRRPV